MERLQAYTMQVSAPVRTSMDQFPQYSLVPPGLLPAPLSAPYPIAVPPSSLSLVPSINRYRYASFLSFQLRSQYIPVHPQYIPVHPRAPPSTP